MEMETETIQKVSKHSLDSDEEENSGDEDKYDVLQGSDIEGEEDGDPGMEGDIKVTPFNLKDELEEGHFDKSGHFHWDKEKEVRDDWVDSIDWVKIKPGQSGSRKRKASESNSSDDESSVNITKEYDPQESYAKILKLMSPEENVRQTLQRLGRKSKKLSSAERLKMKKDGIVDESSKLVAEFSALTNEILYRTGNTNIYEENYKTIQKKAKSKNVTTADDELDMYADDFKIKEMQVKEKEAAPEDKAETDEISVTWEFKWKKDDTDIHGPFSTEQMQIWIDEEYFKDGVFVRKIGDDHFYQSNRIDFELYL